MTANAVKEVKNPCRGVLPWLRAVLGLFEPGVVMTRVEHTAEAGQALCRLQNRRSIILVLVKGGDRAYLLIRPSPLDGSSLRKIVVSGLLDRGLIAEPLTEHGPVPDALTVRLSDRTASQMLLDFLRSVGEDLCKRAEENRRSMMGSFPIG